MPRRLILFAKRPRPGRVKTRLVPPLDEDQTLALYRAFLEDQVRFVHSFRSDGIEVELCLDEPAPSAGEIPGPVGDLAFGCQGPGDLGERMLRAISHSHEGGADHTVIVGADAPSLPRDRVETAFRRLADAADPVVICPAEDGGYVLIGMNRPHAEVFHDVRWGGADVMATTRRRAAEARIELTEIDPWYDVDDGRSLGRLYRDLVRGTVSPGRSDATLECLRRLARDPILGFLDAALTEVV